MSGTLPINGNVFVNGTLTAVGDITAANFPVPANAISQTNPSNRVPNSTSYFLMNGLGASITPATSGNLAITVSGNLTTSSGNAVGLLYQISYGTGAAPSPNTPLTGTQVGAIQEYSGQGFASVPFSIQAAVPGLTKGTTYWVDLAARKVTSEVLTFSGLSVSIVEN